MPRKQLLSRTHLAGSFTISYHYHDDLYCHFAGNKCKWPENDTTNFFERREKRLNKYKDESIPEFIFKDINGKNVKLSSFKAKYLLLDFWETSCGPCLAEIPQAQKLQDRIKQYYPPVIWLTISSDKNVEKWKQVVKEKKMPRINLLSTRDANTNTFHVNFWPTYRLLDPEGKIIGYNLPSPSEGPALEYLIYKAIHGIYAADAYKAMHKPTKNAYGGYDFTPEVIKWGKEVNWTQ